MANKIEILKTFLPAIMVEQRFNTIYIKICDRIHNLTEEECSSMFLVMKMGVEEILTEKLEKKKRKTEYKN